MVQTHPEPVSGERHVRFFQRKSVQTALPFVTSLLFHVGLVVIALSVVKVVTVVTTVKSIEAHPVEDGGYSPEPVADLKNILNPGVGDDATRSRKQIYDMVDVDEKSTKFQPGNADLPNLNPGGGAGDDQAMIGIGPGSLNKGGDGAGFGPGFGPGAGEAPRGPFGPYGAQSDGGTFVSPRGARSIVYVCDATGSMTPMFSSLRRELTDAVGRLSDLQFFNVIFFSDNKTAAMAPSLQRASAAAKAAAAKFVEGTTSRGLTNPIPAIRQAFAQNPELIYVLTDGFDQVDDLESVVQEFDRLNPKRTVKVNTILIGGEDQKDLVDVLRRIAKEHGGTMKIVSKEDF